MYRAAGQQKNKQKKQPQKPLPEDSVPPAIPPAKPLTSSQGDRPPLLDSRTSEGWATSTPASKSHPTNHLGDSREASEARAPQERGIWEPILPKDPVGLGAALGDTSCTCPGQGSLSPFSGSTRV